MELKKICEQEEKVIEAHKERRSYDELLIIESNDIDAPAREKKLSRIERHKSDVADIECDWGKFPEVKKGWGRKNCITAPHNDFELSFKMVIVDNQYPNVLIKQELLWPLQTFIFNILKETGRPYAKIGISNIVDGALRVNAFGPKAVDWLKRLEGLTVEGITLKVVKSNELLQFTKARNNFKCSSQVLHEQVSSIEMHNKNIDHEQKLAKKFGNVSYTRSSLIKMAIICENYPCMSIEERMIPSIRAMVNEMLNVINDPKPKINIIQVVGGALHVDCEGKNSVDFLQRFNGKSLETLTLKIINANDVPKPVKMIWTTKIHLTDTPKMLEYLQRWNKKLRIRDWKIVYTNISGYYLRRVILMDVVSATVIKAANYNLFAGVEFTRFKLCENSDTSPAPLSICKSIRKNINTVKKVRSTDTPEAGVLGKQLQQLNSTRCLSQYISKLYL